jgi:hypothetical protein
MLLHLHLGLLSAAPKPFTRIFRLDRGQEIDEEAEHVEREDERDSPLEDSGGIAGLLEVGYCESDGEDDFYKDEGEFYPEGGAEDAVLAEIFQVLVQLC